MWLTRQIFPTIYIPIKMALTSQKKTTSSYFEVFLIICWPILITYHLLMEIQNVILVFFTTFIHNKVHFSSWF